MVQCSLFYDAPTQVKYFDSDFNALANLDNSSFERALALSQF